MTTLRKGQLVTYRARDGEGPLIEAIVRTAHRDESCTVEARFVLNDDGSYRPGFLGYRYKIFNGDLTPCGAPDDETAAILQHPVVAL
jgi:hypothetical protein